MSMGRSLTATLPALNSPILERVISKELQGREQKQGTRTMLEIAFTVSCLPLKVNLGGEAQSASKRTLTNQSLQGAPECHGADEIEQVAPRLYKKAADIWSLGCLFSNMLIRSGLGEEGVNMYRDARVAENRDTIMAKYAPECFHNGVGRLKCVDEFHTKALQKYPDDDVLLAVSNTILDHMLRPRDEREADALTIRGSWLNRINASNNSVRRPAAPATSSPTSPGSPSSQPAPVVSPPSRASTGFSTVPPPPPGFFRQTTLPPTPIPRTSTAGSTASAGTGRIAITVREIAEHFRRPQKSWPWFLRSGADLATTFPGLSSPLSAVGQRNHVCCPNPPQVPSQNDFGRPLSLMV